MKKIFTVFVFALFLALSGLNANSARAEASGCMAGDLFNRTTGAACGALTAQPECKPGDLFSSLTGAPCTGVVSQDDSVSVSTDAANFKALFKTNFKVGLKGNNDVRALQQFLKDQGYYFGKIDGSYGRITDRAVGDFRADNSINVSLPPTVGCTQDGTKCIKPPLPPLPVVDKALDAFAQCVADSGAKLYGAFWSPYTQELKKFFTNSSRLPYVECSTADGQSQIQECKDKKIDSYPTWVFSDGSSKTGKISLEELAQKTSCGLPKKTEDSSPVISGVKGPQTLRVGQQETWSVSAYDRSGGNLSYSVYWGDENSMTPMANSMGGGSTVQQSATFTHSYSQAGVYSPTFVVTNTAGLSAKASLSVNVGGSTTENHYPVIQPIAVQSDIKVGQSVNFNFSATDADNDDLSWGVMWGENQPSATSSCPVYPHTGTGQNWSYSASHVWNNAGRYNITVYVNDCRGGSDKESFVVEVGGTTTSSITVLSPLGTGGEAWKRGTTQSFKWQDTNNISTHEIILTDAGPFCSSGTLCPHAAPATYTVANTQASSYDWVVGKSLEGRDIPDGFYIVKVCQTGTSVCSTNASYIKIASGIQPTSINHSADLNHDWKIDASELTAFQTLYEYREGTVRTGEYNSVLAVSNLSSNGNGGGVSYVSFNPGPSISGVSSGGFHSADTNKDWKISLTELLRVIELKNSAGYKVQAGTEDGFAPL